MNVSRLKRGRAAAAAVCVLGLLGVVPTALAARPSDDLAANPGSVTRVPIDFRPQFRWWWPTAAVDPGELRTELRAMKAAGFGSVEQSLLANAKEWGTQTFRQRTLTALREANRLGMDFDITLGPGWPISSPSVEDLNREASVQDLHYGAVELNGPTAYVGPVPDRPPSGGGRQRLIAVTAIRVAGDGTPQVLDPGSAVDLTGRVSGGALNWQVPPGRWKLFGFWMRPSLMRGKSPAGGGEGWLVPDHFGRSATELVLGDFDRMLFSGGDITPLLRRNGGDVFEDSYEIDHGRVAAGQSAVFWTPAMPGEFARRRGYALTPLLPGLFRQFTFPSGLGERLKHDFEHTLNDLLIDNHLRPIRGWANRKGLRSRVQAYQAGLGDVGTSENSRLAAVAQRPDVETLGFGDPIFAEFLPVQPGSADGRAVINRYRQVVSGAHLSGARAITNEWGAMLNGQFRLRLEDLKAFADRSLAAGVSRMALHGFAYRPYDRTDPDLKPRPSWPGWCAFCGRALEFSDSWNQRWPQLKSLRGLANYLGRAGAALRGGRPRVDLTLLNATSVVRGIGATPSAGTPADALRKALHAAGYSWDAIDPVSVPGERSVSRRRLLPRGPAYKALVVDDQESLPAATAERLVALARAGLPVALYGRVPAAGVGFKDAASEDARVRAALNTLRGLRNVRTATTPTGLLAALRLSRWGPTSGRAVRRRWYPSTAGRLAAMCGSFTTTRRRE